MNKALGSGAQRLSARTWMVAHFGTSHCPPCPRHLLGTEIPLVRGSVTPKANSPCWLADGSLSGVDCSSRGVLATFISCPKAQTGDRCAFCLGFEYAGSLPGMGTCLLAGRACWQSGSGVPWVIRRLGPQASQLAQALGAVGSTLLRQRKPVSTRRPRASFSAGSSQHTSRLLSCLINESASSTASGVSYVARSGPEVNLKDGACPEADHPLLGDGGPAHDT